MASPATNSESFLFHTLPEDLIRSIFETAAEDTKASNWAYPLVSKTIQSWVEPILYKHIQLYNRTAILQLNRTIISHPSKSANFFSAHVKTLHIDPPVDCVDIFSIVCACSGIVCLDISRIRERNEDPEEDYRVGRHNAWETLRLKRLSLNSAMLPNSLSSPQSSCVGFRNLNSTFACLTHLDFLWDEFSNYKKGSAPWYWPSISQLNSVTHLCITITSWASPFESTQDLPSFAAQLRSSIVVCVFFVCGGYGPTLKTTKDPGWMGVDSRIVLAVNHGFYRSVAQQGYDGAWIKQRAISRSIAWEAGPWGKEEDAFWDRAVQMAMKEREGQIM